MMLPKTNRLQLRQEKDFFIQAKRKNFSLFQILYRASTSPETQFAIVVPKKIYKSSAKRHKLVRQMRQILLQNKDKFDRKQVVVVMFFSSVDKTFKELTEAVIKASEQL